MKNESDKRQYLNNSLNHVPTMHEEWKSEYCLSKELQQLTNCQGTPEWFLLQNFCVTSTVTGISLDEDATSYTKDQLQWFSLKVNIHIHTNDKEIDVIYVEMDVNELVKMRENGLIEIFKSCSYKTTGNKIDLVSCIKLGINQNGNKRIEIERLAQTWFMKPLPKKHCLYIGLVNESSILNVLTHVHLFDNNTKVKRVPVEFGLSRRSDKP